MVEIIFDNKTNPTGEDLESLRTWDAESEAPELAMVSEHPVTILFGEVEIRFPTAEHAWQISKFIFPDGTIKEPGLVEELMSIVNPLEVKRLTRINEVKFIPEYSQKPDGGFRYQLPLRRIIQIINAKTNSLPIEIIEKYRDKIIYESPGESNDPNPGVWGVELLEDENGDFNATGSNYIGRIWMKAINRRITEA